MPASCHLSCTRDVLFRGTLIAAWWESFFTKSGFAGYFFLITQALPQRVNGRFIKLLRRDLKISFWWIKIKFLLLWVYKRRLRFQLLQNLFITTLTVVQTTLNFITKYLIVKNAVKNGKSDSLWTEKKIVCGYFSWPQLTKSCGFRWSNSGYH